MNDVRELTRESFAYQWTAFGEMAAQFRQDFLNYIDLVPEFFAGKRGLDAGCGFGRHLWHAADFGATMVGMDFSRSIVRARAVVRDQPRARLVQGDIEHPPFAPGSFDFVYSIGVLHHMPDPEAAFRCLTALVAPGGSIFVWVYSKQRRVTNALLELARAVTSRLPRAVTRALAFLAACVDWGGFILPYRGARRWLGPAIDRLTFPRIVVYSRYPFQVVHADWFDRLAAPIRFYYDSDDLAGWAERAGIVNVRISPTGLYGWRLYGETPTRFPRRL